MSAQIMPRAKLIAGLTAAALLWTAGCASEEKKTQKAQPGTPEFSWLSAKEAYKAGNYEKAANLLSELSRKETPYTAQAAPMALVLTHGMTHAYLELADKYAAGAKRARTGGAAFYRLTSEYRSKASESGMRYAELARKFLAAMPEGDVNIAFDLPQGQDADPPQYKVIESGRMIPQAEIPMVESQVIARWELKSAANIVGERAKPEKAKDKFVNGEAKVPQPVFLPALAFSLYETAEMFGPKKLNQPNRVILALCGEAEKILGKVKPSKDTADLLKKIKDVQKKTPA